MVESFMESFEGSQKATLEKLHRIIMSLPEMRSAIRYKIPFYRRISWICYLNPLRKNQGIELVFIRGKELSNQQGILISKSRKQVMGIEFYSINQINEAQILEILQEAILVDEVHLTNKNDSNKTK